MVESKGIAVGEREGKPRLAVGVIPARSIARVLGGLLLLLIWRRRCQRSLDSGPHQVQPEIPKPISSARTAIQYSEFLPQVHLTLVSVLQGVAIAILASRFDAVDPLRFPETLYYLASVLIVALVWFMYSWGFVTFSYPLHAWRSLLEFGLMAAEAFAFAFVGHPAKWGFGVAATAAAGAALRFLNIQLMDRSHYEQPDRLDEDVHDEKVDAWLYVAFAVALAVLASFYIVSGSSTAEVLLPVFTAALALYFLSVAHSSVLVDIEKLLTPSQWEFDDRRQVVQRRSRSR